MSNYINSNIIKTTEIINEDNDKNIINNKDNKINISQNNGDVININNKLNINGLFNMNSLKTTTSGISLNYSYYKMNILKTINNNIINHRVNYCLNTDIQINYRLMYGSDQHEDFTINYNNVNFIHTLYYNNSNIKTGDDFTILNAKASNTFQTYNDGYLLIQSINIPDVNTNRWTSYSALHNARGFFNLYRNDVYNYGVNGIIRRYNNSTYAVLCHENNSHFYFTHDSPIFIDIRNLTFKYYIA